MKKKNGFTLVELLAVIVILSVLVLLAVPSVLKMLDGARKDTFELETERIIEAAKTAYSSDVMDGDEKGCYSLEELKPYLEKTFPTGSVGSVQITIPETGPVVYKVWYYNGKYSVANQVSGSLTVGTTAGTSTFNTCGA